MDQEIDLMLQKKSQIIDTGMQEYRMPEKEVAAREEKQQERKLGQLVGENLESPSLSLDALEKSLQQESGDMDLIRQKGRIFMQRYEARNRMRRAV